MVLCLCVLMFGHIIQLWNLYFKSRKEPNKPLAINDEEMNTLKSCSDY